MATHTEDLPQLKRALQALQQMRARLDAVEQARSEPIAVVGMACRFPGGADTPDAYWRLLVEGRDAITEVPLDRWPAAALYDPDPDVPGKMATRWGGFLEAIDRFDPAFFGISPREASEMDPQQRLLLEVSWEALESAGETLPRLSGSATGVFIGIHSHSSDYASLQMCALEDVGTYTSTGTAHSIVANRLSYWLDLRGPSLAVDTACSSSLVAAHLAVQSLRAGECDLALAGGVNLLLAPEVTVALSRMRMMAADGRCKTFDARADGFVRGEGCGVVVLKRLSDAEANGDRILALIAGSAVNQDGATNGLTAPSGLAQREVVRRALRDGRVDPARITYLETHGTGTALGDPIEVEALAEVLGRAGDDACALGAVKTNIGHLESAAGIAGLIKAILALQHEAIPPNLHFQEPNPHLSLGGTRFAVPTEAHPWPAGTDRHAGVSSFGFGGTNAHLVLREAALTPPPPLAHAGEGMASPGQPGFGAASLLPISARTPEALQALVRAYVELLGGSPPPLLDLCYTAAVRRTHHEHRLTVVGSTAQEMAGSLAAFLAGEAPEAIAVGHADPDVRRRLVLVFSGQGSQWAGMGRALMEDERVFREKLEACDVLFRPLAGWSLLDELAAPAERSRLHETEVTQPVLFAIQLALAELWRSRGIRADAVVGHSVGEVAAAHFAGVLNLEQAIRVVFLRGRLMQRATGAGRMAAVGLNRLAAEAFLAQRGGGISLAAVNGPSSTVLSGNTDAVEEAVAELTERGVFARLLPVDAAAHSPQMEPLRAELVDALAGLTPQPPTLPLFSTVTGEPARPGDFSAQYWGRNLREPVLFAQAVGAALQGGVTDFLEVSPHPLLRTPLEQCAGEADALIAGSLDRDLPERTALLRSLGALHSRGHAVDWSAQYPSGGQVVPLPGYPWQRRRYWIETGRNGRQGDRERARVVEPRGGKSPFAGQLLSSPAIQGSLFESHLSAETVAVFGDHRIGDDAVLPAACFLELLLTAGRAALGPDVPAVEDLVLHHPLIVPGAGERTVQCILQPPADGHVSCEIHSRQDDQHGGWTLHATGTLVVGEIPVNGGRRASSLAEIRARLGKAEHGRYEGQLVVMESIQRAEGETLARLRLREGEAEDVARTALLDSCFRLLAAWGSRTHHAPISFVVASLHRLRLYQRIPPIVHCHTRSRDQDAVGGENLAVDAQLFDEDGVLLAEVEGVRFARVSRSEEWLYEVRWRPRGILSRSLPGPAAPLPSPGDLAEHLMAIPAVVGEAANESAALVNELDRLSAAYAARALRDLGLSLDTGGCFADRDVADRLDLSPHHRRLLRRILEILHEDGVLQPADTGWRVLRTPEEIDLGDALDRVLERFPAHRAELTLFRRCASSIAHVMRGECDPLQLLFPEGSADEIEHLYREAPLSRAPNSLVRQAIARVADELPAGRVLRILEIGAGTGGTTSHVVDVLPPDRTDYVFTDVSRGLLDRAAMRLREYPFVRFELLDLEQDPEAQGFAAEQFDLVLAANVLHATAHLRASLARVRRLLRPSGLLLLLEGTRPTRWIDLVFGLTEGWWKFADADLRLTHPLLPPETWTALLEEGGFSEARTIRAGDAAPASRIYDQALIVARAAAGAPLSRSATTDPVVGSWLIVAEETGAAQPLAAAIRVRGGACTVAVPAEAVERARTWLREATAAPVTVVYLTNPVAPGRATAAALQDRIRSGCATLAAVALALSDAGSTSGPRLWIVTRGAQPVHASDSVDPAAAALWGLGRSIALEYPESWGGLVDLQAGGDPAADAEQLLAQISAGDVEDQAAFRDGSRFVPRLSQISGSGRGEPVLREDGAYLITGGFGSLGLKLARWLAARGAGHLVLLGRTPLPDRSSWASLTQSDPAHPKVAAVLDLERLGATVTAVAGDVADPDAVRWLLGRFGVELPPLKGVFHTAAVMDFTPLRRLRTEEIDAVLRPKVAGGWVLHEFTRDLALDHFVLFSSVAGLWGSRGMAYYAAANQFLDALAHHRRALGLPALTVNWGGWEGGGSSAAASRFLEQSDFHLLPAGAALESLGAAMAAGVTQRAIASVDWRSLKASYELHRPRPFLSEIQVAAEDEGGTVATASIAAPAKLLRDLKALAAEEAYDLLTSHVRGQVAEVLGLDPAQLMERGQGFFKLGMDSLMTVELRGRLERSVGLRLPTTIAFEYPTVEALSAFLAGKLLQSTPVEAPPPSASSQPRISRQPEPPLENLSEDELAATLDAALAGLLDDEVPAR